MLLNNYVFNILKCVKLFKFKYVFKFIYLNVYLKYLTMWNNYMYKLIVVNYLRLSFY